MAQNTTEKDHNFKVAKNLETFSAIYKYLDLMYVDTLNADEVVGNGINYMLHSLDPYTVYYPEDKVKDLDLMISGKYAGIGAVIRYNFAIKNTIIDQPYENMPASEAGLKKGDIISLDLVVELNGYMGDSCITVPVGHTNKKNAQLLKVTEEALFAGIKQAVPGNTVGDIGHAVESYVRPYGYDVLRDYVGHGIGIEMHEDPEIPNYGTPGHGPRLEEGMVICIEPMVTMGRADIITLRDGWGVVTADGLPAAHCEHTIAITGNGPRILTLRD